MKNLFEHISPYAITGLLLLLPAGVFTIILIYLLELPAAPAAADSLLSVFLFAGAAFGFRFQVKQIPFDKTRMPQFVMSHLIAGGIISFLWVSLVTILVKEFSFTGVGYEQFLSSSMLWRIGTGVTLYFVIIAFLYLNRYYNLAVERTERESELKAMVAEAELKSLRFQIHPHFLFNSLNSIASLTDFEPHKAKDMTIKLSELMRYTLSKDSQQFVSLKTEVEHIRKYLDIEKVRFGDRFSVETDIDGNLLNEMIPALLMQPLMENSIKHGVYEAVEPVTIRIRISKENEFMKIVVSNQFDPDNMETKGEGVGLKNIAKRLDLLYQRKNLLTTKSENNIFVTTIFLPLKD
jgi:sensor histidine kinase YesM